MIPNKSETIVVQVTASNEKLNSFHTFQFIELPTCRICLMEMKVQDIFNPCQCKGQNSYFHQQCLVQWLKKSKKHKDSFMTYFALCEVCKGRIFLVTKTNFRCITMEEVRQELFQRHICCTTTTLIFLSCALIIFGVILYVISEAETKAEKVIYAVGITVTMVIIVVTLIVYVYTYVLKSEVDILGIDKNRKKTCSSSDQKLPRAKHRRVEPQDAYVAQFNQINNDITLDQFAQNQ